MGKQKLDKGSLLISEPFLGDPSFKRTVVLLTEYEKEGTVGFVLNRPLAANLKEAIKDLKNFDSHLNFGGPVQTDTLHYVHRLGNAIEGSLEIFNGVYWGGNFESLKSLLNRGEINNNDIRFYIGYSGWDEGQLIKEISQKSWIVAPAKEEYIFRAQNGNLWRDVLKDLGEEYTIIANFPEDPSLN